MIAPLTYSPTWPLPGLPLLSLRPWKRDMEKYINYSLAASIMHPLSSSAGVGFFFMPPMFCRPWWMMCSETCLIGLFLFTWMIYWSSPSPRRKTFTMFRASCPTSWRTPSSWWPRTASSTFRSRSDCPGKMICGYLLARSQLPQAVAMIARVHQIWPSINQRLQHHCHSSLCAHVLQNVLQLVSGWWGVFQDPVHLSIHPPISWPWPSVCCGNGCIRGGG